MASKYDVAVHHHGSVVLVHPLTEQAKEWINANVQEDAQFFGQALVVEPRYVENLILGMHDDGLIVPGV